MVVIPFISLSCLMISISATLEVQEKESGLKIEIISKPEECEKFVKKGQQLAMHYTGTLEDGTKFDSSLDRGEPIKFQISKGIVIKGWDEGILGMCIGEKRRLVVPSHLGYGDEGKGEKIPGGATLHFDVELLGIGDGTPVLNVFKKIDTNMDRHVSKDELKSYLEQQVSTKIEF